MSQATSLPFYEPFIQRHFPAWGARRNAFRAAGASASYRQALTTRVDTAWRRSQWSYIGGTLTEQRDLSELRDRGRQVYKDNPIAKALVDVETENIAPSFTLHARTDAPDFNAEAEDKWVAFLEQADITGRHPGDSFIQFLWKTFRIDGDGGVKFVDKFGASKLQHIPADLIFTPDDRWADFRVMNGVEVDEAMTPQILHVLTLDNAGNREFSQVRLAEPGREALFVAHTDYGIPLAVRGLTCFNPCFALLDNLDGLIDATTTAARLQAAVALVFQEENVAKVMGGFPTQKDSQGKETRVITIENGSIKVVGKAGAVTGVNATQPLPQMPEFIRTLNRIIDNVFGMPLEIASRDLSTINFSGGRIGLLGYFRRCRMWQKWFVLKVLTPVYRWWISREVKRGRFKSAVPADYWSHEFSGREWDYTDPQTEMQATQLELDADMIDEFAASAQRGRDYENTLQRKAQARELRKKYGIAEPVRSNLSRDTTTKVTAVDANGNPLPDAASQPLNGVQITSAIDVLSKLTEKTIDPAAAVEFLTKLGIAPDRADAIAKAASTRTDISPGQQAYQQQVFLKLLEVPAARESAVNATKLTELAKNSGLPIQEGYQEPWLPVVSVPGPLVSGDTIQDPEGDIVGGDVEQPLAGNTLPEPGGSAGPVSGEGGAPPAPAPAPVPAPAAAMLEIVHSVKPVKPVPMDIVRDANGRIAGLKPKDIGEAPPQKKG